MKIKATIRILGKTYESKGKTVEEVITKLNPPIAKGVGILVLEKGDLKREKILNPRTINNVFGQASPTMKTIAVRSITILFEDFDK